MNRPLMHLLIAVSLFAVAGCRHQPPVYIVCLLDISKSITPDGVNLEFGTVDGMVEGLPRGDELTIIPITGNAMSDASGHILRFSAPTERQPYDHDLAVFRQKAHVQIRALRDAALKQPAIRTDIIGTLGVVKEEFAANAENDPHHSRVRTLVIFSDFIEDDRIYHFASDPALSSNVSARAFAGRVHADNDFDHTGIRVLLNTLESTDMRRLSPERQNAIRAFWQTYIPQSSWGVM